MLLSNDDMSFIQKVIEVASATSINNVIIEPGKIRGVDDQQTIMIFHTTDVPVFEWESIGINRMNILATRLELASTFDKKIMEVTTDTAKDGTTFVRSLTMKNKKSRIEYRCANPMTIKAPKNLLDQPAYNFSISDGDVQSLSRGLSAMSTDEVKFIGCDDTVVAELTDISGDVLSIIIDTTATNIISGDPLDFTYKYPAKTLLPLLKRTQTMSISSRGLMKVNVNTFDLYILPRA